MPEVQNVVPLPGMKQGVESRLAPPGTLALAQNVRWDRAGRVRKRGGTASLGVLPATPTDGGSWVRERLACIGREIYRQDDRGNDWRILGNDPPILPERREGLALDEVTGVTAGTIVGADNGQTLVSAWAAGPDVQVAGLTADGEVQWRAAAQSGGSPRLLSIGSTTYVLRRTSIGEIKVATLTTSGSAAGSLSADTTLVSSGGVLYYDVARLDGSSSWLLAYHNGSVGATLTVKILAGLSATSTYSFAASNSPYEVAVAGVSGGRVWFAYRDGASGAGVKLRTFDNSLTLIDGPTTLTVESASITFWGQPTIGKISSTEALILCTTKHESGTTPALSQLGVRAWKHISGTGVVGSSDSYGWALASKIMPAPVSSGTRQTVLVQSHHTVYSNSLFLGARHAFLEINAVENASTIPRGEIVGMTYEREASGSSEHLPETAVVEYPASSSVWRYVTLAGWRARESLGALDLLIFRHRDNEGFTPTPRTRHRRVERVGPLEYIAGASVFALPTGTWPGAPAVGTSAQPRYAPLAGFPVLPLINPQASAGSGLSASTTYTYVGTYEQLDEQGQRWQSEPSVPFSATTGSGSNERISIPIAGFSGVKRGGIVCHLWRSWDGGPFHRVTPDAGAPAITIADGTGGLAFQVFVDSMPNATAATKEELGTAPGALLPSNPLSGGRIACVGDGRMFARGWDPRVVWVTKAWVPGEGLQFVDDDVFRIVFPEDVTALGYIDGTLVGFSRSRIYLVAGDGPDDRGTVEYPPPRALPVDAGCIEERSVVVTSRGLLYQAPRGIMLLPRGFGPPVFVGADVADELEANPVILGAARSSTELGEELVHFPITDNETHAQGTSARVLVLDLELMAWSVDVLAYGAAALGSRAGRLVYVTDTPHVSMVRELVEDGTVVDDRNATAVQAWIEMRLRFGELRPFGLAGWGELKGLWLLGEMASSCILHLDTTLDEGIDVPTQPEPRQWAIPGTLGVTVGRALYAGAALSHPTGTALRVELWDAAPAAGFPGVGVGAGCVLHALALEHDVQPGLRRLQKEEMR